MKVFIAVIIILCILITGFILTQYYFTTSFDVYFSMLDEIDASIEKKDYPRIEALSKELSDKLAKHSFWLYMLTDREPLDNANTASFQLVQFAKYKDAAEIASFSAQLRLMLHHIVEKSVLSIENIL